jgi:hypothetical protein
MAMRADRVGKVGPPQHRQARRQHGAQGAHELHMIHMAARTIVANVTDMAFDAIAEDAVEHASLGAKLRAQAVWVLQRHAVAIASYFVRAGHQVEVEGGG